MQTYVGGKHGNKQRFLVVQESHKICYSETVRECFFIKSLAECDSGLEAKDDLKHCIWKLVLKGDDLLDTVFFQYCLRCLTDLPQSIWSEDCIFILVISLRNQANVTSKLVAKETSWTKYSWAFQLGKVINFWVNSEENIFTFVKN